MMDIKDKKDKKAALAAYLKEARTWETDKVIAAEKSKRMAWRITIFSAILATASVIAVIGLTPLKQVSPFVIRVDDSTGIVDVVTTLKSQQTNYSEVINKYFAQRYVRAREGYNRATADVSYIETGIMSAPVEQQRYHDYFTPQNPQSPLNIYKDTAKVRISIKSVSFVKKDVAQVRYTREIDRPPNRPEVSHWVATLHFQYVGSPMKEKDRAINPLGFQVMDYRTDPESLTAVERKTPPRTEPTLTATLPLPATPIPSGKEVEPEIDPVEPVEPAPAPTKNN